MVLRYVQCNVALVSNVRVVLDPICEVRDLVYGVQSPVYGERYPTYVVCGVFSMDGIVSARARFQGKQEGRHIGTGRREVGQNGRDDGGSRKGRCGLENQRRDQINGGRSDVAHSEQVAGPRLV
jgi:hypothetical protein